MKARIRTRYQRMKLACLIAERLKESSDPNVRSRAIEIEYALSAPASTLNNMLEYFTDQDIVSEVAKQPDAATGLLEHIRAVRSAKALSESCDVSMPWCEACRSYHARPKSRAHHRALKCRRPL